MDKGDVCIDDKEVVVGLTITSLNGFPLHIFPADLNSLIIRGPVLLICLGPVFVYRLKLDPFKLTEEWFVLTFSYYPSVFIFCYSEFSVEENVVKKHNR